MAEKDTGASFAVGFLLGAVVGVAIGFLYAPKPGREMRAMLKEKAEEAAAAVERRVEEKLGRRKSGK